MILAPPPLLRPLQFVTGKGGVGKSAISAAIALGLARAGRKVLLFQVNAQDAHAEMLQVQPIGPELREVRPNLFAVNTTPADALREYALLSLRSKLIYNAVFENRLVKRFLRFVPSLAELNMLGKAWYHLGLGAADSVHRPVFDHVIIDAPATGHGQQFVRVARVIADGAVAGPLKNQALQMALTIENPELCALHIVSLAEYMPVQETIGLQQKILRDALVPPGIVVLNRFGPWRLSEPKAIADQLEQLASAQLGSTQLGPGQQFKQTFPEHWDCARYRLQHERDQKQQAERLRQALDQAVLQVQDQFAALQDVSSIADISHALFSQAGLSSIIESWEAGR